ncbi:MAG: hypothetical protein SGILL_005440 [Bacillariaceae sp.]
MNGDAAAERPTTSVEIETPMLPEDSKDGTADDPDTKRPLQNDEHGSAKSEESPPSTDAKKPRLEESKADDTQDRSNNENGTAAAQAENAESKIVAAAAPEDTKMKDDSSAVVDSHPVVAESSETVPKEDSENNDEMKEESSKSEEAAAPSASTEAVTTAAAADKDKEKKTPRSPTQLDVQGDRANYCPSKGGKRGKKNLKYTKTKHMDPRILAIRKRIQMACRHDDLRAGMEAYEEATNENIKLEASSFYQLLNLCDGLRRKVKAVHVGTPKQQRYGKGREDAVNDDSSKTDPSAVSMDDNNNVIKKVGASTDVKKETDQAATILPEIDQDTRMEYAIKIRDRMKQENLPMNDNAYTAFIRLLSTRRRFEEAEKTLNEAESIQQCKTKMRLFSPLLIAYCEEGRMLDALGIWKRLRMQKPPLDLTELEYLAFMRCAILTGDTLVMNYAFTELAEYVLVPSKDTVAALIEWYESTQSQHTESVTNQAADRGAVSQLLEEISKTDPCERPLSMGPVVIADGWQVSSACPVDTKTGELQEGCLKGQKLQPVPVSERAFREMSNMNESIMFDGKLATDVGAYQGGGKGKKRNNFDPKQRKDEWRRFVCFLERKEKETGSSTPFDVVVDGANIGFYGMNYADAPPHVDYEQIDWVVRHLLEDRKQRVLLVMHSRHFSDRMLPPKFRPLVDSWREKGVLYKTPSGMNDDWFWMHAALKYKLLVVTNDEMRDHLFQMLSPRFFLRWRDRHRVGFSFGIWHRKARGDGNPWGTKQREVILEYPDIYSRRIQRLEDGLVIPLAKRGDENRYLDGSHFASEDEPEEETYLCIRPKTQEIGDVKGEDTAKDEK